MTITVNEELKAYIDPLTSDEYEALERSLLAEGCRDALVVWGDVLVDGHNRYGICQKHGLPFQAVQSKLFQTMEDVHLWMIDQHLGRRLNSREEIAKVARLSSNQVVMIEKIQKLAAPELVAAIKSGTVSLNAAAAVATLPEEEQKAAVMAGKDELKQAAKRVREAKSKPRDEAVASQDESDHDELQMLRQRVDELTAENAVLRRQVSELQNPSAATQAPW